jgi:MFS family permease
MLLGYNLRRDRAINEICLRDAQPHMMSAREPCPPGVVLTCALFSMTMSGTVYWLPSLSVALAEPLSLSSSQTAFLAASGSMAYVLSILGGLACTRLGPSRATLLGSVGIALSYGSLALLVHLSPATPLLPAAAIFCAVSLSSYCVYASAQTAAVNAYPVESRGPVNGLMSAVYAMSSGIIGAIQAAFFPAFDKQTVVALLLTVSAMAAIPGLCSALSFPSVVGSESGARSNSRGVYVRLNETDADVGASTESELRSVNTGYISATAVAFVLQLCAFSDWHGEALFWGIRAELALAFVLLAILAVGLALPAISSLLATWGIAADTTLMTDSTSDEPTPLIGHTLDANGAQDADDIAPLAELVVDVRFQFLLAAMVCLAGCCGLTLLNTSQALVASRYDYNLAPVDVTDSFSRGVRAVIVVFSSASVGGRLFAGWVMMQGSKSHTELRFTLLQADSIVLGVGMLLCAVAQSWWLLIAASIVGFGHGFYFAIAPALTQDLYGLRSFPRDFAVTVRRLYWREPGLVTKAIKTYPNVQSQSC